jgi:cytoskeletal protein RodZ
MMTDGERDEPLIPRKAGERLRAARQALGLSLDDLAQRTRIPLRHLEALENASYEGLPSPTYAVGFARAYARVVGEDEVRIANDVRADTAAIVRRTPEYQPYVTADPSRIPSRALVIVASGVALAIVILASLWFGAGWRHHDENAPSAPAPSPVTAAVPPPVRAAPTGGQVILTASDDVWLRVYDKANKTLFLGVMKPGQSYTVPGDADHPEINVGRPDKLKVTLNGSAIPPLGDGKRPIKDVAVDGASVAARLAAAPAPAASSTPAAGPVR